MGKKQIFYIAILLVFCLLLFTACAAKPTQGTTPDDYTVIEEGTQKDPVAVDDPAGPEEPQQGTTAEEPASGVDFADFGEDSSLEDLIAAKAKIESYYFEQTVRYADSGHVFLQVWYKANRMKLISSVDGYGLTESYYDYDAGTITTYSPGSGEAAIQMAFDPAGSDAPENPVKEDYSAYEVLGGETIDRQYCLVCETPVGDKLWISSKYGFPVQAEYTDSLGERMTASYKNIQINQVQDEEVLPPDDMEVYYFGNN